MQRAADTFHLVDLASQAEAVQALLAGRSLGEKIAWFDQHGKLSPVPDSFAGHQVYAFESATGLKCAFLIKDESLVFIGDNTTWSVPRPTNAVHNPPMQRTGRGGTFSLVGRLWAGR